jgi:sulfide:quinone oxidoreductase
VNTRTHDIIIVGGGAAGIATASSLLKREPGLDIAIIEPREEHYYQPGWTMVGGGIFESAQTVRKMAKLMPQGVTWIKQGCKGFEPESNTITLTDGSQFGYKYLIVAPGLKLDWDRIEGLGETLGHNNVTSNYRFDLAPYTWELIRNMKTGRALFSQPPMPIKCAGAPQKAMYLACDAWKRRGVLKNIDVEFHNAGGVLFGVEEYVPPLMKYVDGYGIDLCFNEKLVAVDGEAKRAVFETAGPNGDSTQIERDFEMMHVTPPQTALDFVADSAIANEAGWVDVDQFTLQHNRFENIFGLGDAGSTPNAKTAAAVRKQAPIVAHNLLRVIQGEVPNAHYDGYGSCPLTVERGKIVLAEFGYGGQLQPTMPNWMLDGTKPSRRAWFLKERMLPAIYFDMMLSGNELFAKPNLQLDTAA